MSVGSLNQIVMGRAQSDPQRNAYGEWGSDDVATWLSYGDLDRRTRAIAAELQRRSRAGERALLLFAPGLDYVSAFYGCLMAGVIAVPAYPPDPARLDRTLPRLISIVADAQATVVLTTAAIAALFESMAAHVPEMAKLTCIAIDGLADADGWKAPLVDANTIAFLQYTSGSTGHPKGVQLTHGNLLHNVAQIAERSRATPEQTIMTWLPPYHDMGLIGSLIHALYVGCPVVQMSPAAFLIRPIRWLQAMTKTRATMSGGPNFAFDLCVQKVSQEQKQTLDLSSWQVAYVAAEPVRPRTLARFAEEFAECGFRPDSFWPCYGLAESTLMVTSRSRGAGHRARAALVGSGLAAGETEIAIIDPETQRRLGDGEVGEIWCRSPSVAAGYWGRPEESAATFGAHTSDGAGPFLRTGDLGLLDDGELFVTGRIKELIIVRGRKHHPPDLEDSVERAYLGASHHRPGGCVAFSWSDDDGEERLFLAIEVERRQRERRRMLENAPDRRRGADRRHRPFNYRAQESTPVEPPELVRSIRRVIAAEHGIEVTGLFLLRPGTIPKTSSGKKQRLKCARDLIAGHREEDILFAWRELPPSAA